MNYRQAKARADILKALAHPVRVLIVDALQKGDRCVSDLNRMVRLAQSNMSRHLAVLKKAGIVTERRQGNRVYHHLETPCIVRAFGCAAEVVRADHRRRTDAVASEIS